MKSLQVEDFKDEIKILHFLHADGWDTVCAAEAVFCYTTENSYHLEA